MEWNGFVLLFFFSIFFRIFEESFPNVEHPAFFEGTLAEALRAALTENRLVLVYLHADSHEDTPTFCRRVMGYTKNPQTSEERFVADSARGLHEFFTDKFIIWGGDIRSAETFSIADRIRIRAYPALVAFSIYPGNPPTVALLRRWEGAGLWISLFLFLPFFYFYFSFLIFFYLFTSG